MWPQPPETPLPWHRKWPMSRPNQLRETLSAFCLHSRRVGRNKTMVSVGDGAVAHLCSLFMTSKFCLLHTDLACVFCVCFFLSLSLCQPVVHVFVECVLVSCFSFSLCRPITSGACICRDWEGGGGGGGDEMSISKCCKCCGLLRGGAPYIVIIIVFSQGRLVGMIRWTSWRKKELGPSSSTWKKSLI